MTTYSVEMEGLAGAQCERRPARAERRDDHLIGLVEPPTVTTEGAA
ncbi:hypothetical protein [Actinomadura sp. RB99]|nr:hypothetical protein [Actinomadura sp. RB99]